MAHTPSTLPGQQPQGWGFGDSSKRCHSGVARIVLSMRHIFQLQTCPVSPGRAIGGDLGNFCINSIQKSPESIANSDWDRV